MRLSDKILEMADSSWGYALREAGHYEMARAFDSYKAGDLISAEMADDVALMIHKALCQGDM